jgi:hypothetical protein
MATRWVGCEFHTTRTRNHHLNPNSKAIRWQNNTPHSLGSAFSTQTCSKNMQKYNSNIRFWVSGVSFTLPAPEISGVTQTQSTKIFTGWLGCGWAPHIWVYRLPAIPIDGGVAKNQIYFAETRQLWWIVGGPQWGVCVNVWQLVLA